MLRALSIRQFAIIEAQEIEFQDGFTAITGETGAGKSILVDALGWLLGERADTGMIAEGAAAAELSASFEIRQEQRAIHEWLQEHAMDDGDTLLLRRVVPVRGSSRAWINGRSATVGQLGEIGRRLVAIHGQHEHQLLDRPEVQRRLLDQRSPAARLNAVKHSHARWLDARAALDAFEREAGDPAQAELLNFQVRELNALQIAEGEYEALEAEQERLSRQDDILSAIAVSSRLLDGDGEPGVRTMLTEILNRLSNVRELDPSLDGIAAMLDEAAINVDEAISGLERLEHSDEPIGTRLDEVNQRLERALDLARKHRVNGSQLHQLTQELNQRLERLAHRDEERATLQTQVDSSLQAWQDAAAQLSKVRKQAGERLGKQVTDRLKSLGMNQARLLFSIDQQRGTEPKPHGADRIEILFAANPGQTPKPLTRVASGGELSRVSLALMIAARPEDGPEIRVFDEVDAGIGGQTASVVGAFLSEVADRGQAFCVTHLAQVAACADQQVRVRKSSSGGETTLQVDALDPDERREEIARMLGGAVSDKSREHADELLGSAAEASAKRR